MKHQPSTNYLLASLMLPLLCGIAHSFWEVGKGEIFASLDTKYQYDTNVFVNNLERIDHSLTLSPEIQYTNGNGSVQVDARVGYEILRFNRYNDEDTEDFKSSLSFSWPQGAESTYNASAKASFQQNTVADEIVGGRVKSNDTNLSGSLKYKLSDRFGWMIAPTFAEKDARSAGRFSEETWSLSAGANYFYSDRLTFDLSGRYRNTEMEGTPNVSAEDYAVTVGATGDLLAKLTGKVSFGWQQREYKSKSLSKETSPTAQVSVDWAASEKTTFTLAVNKDFSVSSSNQSTDRLTIDVSVKQNLTEKISGSAGITYEDSSTLSTDRSTREDEQWSLNAGLNYTFTRMASARLTVYYAERDSTSASSTFERFYITPAFSIKF